VVAVAIGFDEDPDRGIEQNEGRQEAADIRKAGRMLARAKIKSLRARNKTASGASGPGSGRAGG